MTGTRSRQERSCQKRLHVSDKGLPCRLVRTIVRTAAAAGLAAVADAIEIAHRQAERVETVMRSFVDACLDKLAALDDAVDHCFALLHGRPVIECTHGEERRLADRQLAAQRIAKRRVRLDKEWGARHAV